MPTLMGALGISAEIAKGCLLEITMGLVTIHLMILPTGSHGTTNGMPHERPHKSPVGSNV